MTRSAQTQDIAGGNIAGGGVSGQEATMRRAASGQAPAAMTITAGENLAEEDLFRARFYALLSSLLARPPDGDVLASLSAIEGDESPLGQALDALAAAAREADEEAVGDEFTLLFYGQGQGGELLPYASHYLTGLLYERPLAELRRSMAVMGMEKDGLEGEPEDHIACVLEIMHALIVTPDGGESCLRKQKDFFTTHLFPWAGAFFSDLQTARAAVFYRSVGRLGEVFTAIESEGFGMVE